MFYFSHGSELRHSDNLERGNGAGIMDADEINRFIYSFLGTMSEEFWRVGIEVFRRVKVSRQ